jgi:glyoxylase-like metal-dependent hydrolase (beta-lactamase superfamily II)
MRLHIIDAGTFKCDGGGIFGGVPKILWSRQVKADERNLITLAMRCLLLEIDDRKILIETGAGDKLSWKFIDNNGIENSHLLIDSIEKAGFKAEDISDVIHTHLHWDHCGGGTRFNENKEAVPTFPNANYYCSKVQWDNAMNPNPREGDAYFKNDLLPVKNSGQLKLIDKENKLYPGLSLRIFNGHTPGQIVPIIEYKGKTLVYIADLVPTVANIPLKWIAAYDLYPVTAMEEKEKFLREAYENNFILFFEHDMDYECATLDWDERKGPKVKNKGKLTDFL